MKRALKVLKTLLIGSAALIWTGAGETSDPFLTDRAIPADVLSACARTPAGPMAACDAANFQRRWVAKSLRGDLFVLSNSSCVGSGCRAWLVEQTSKTVTTLLGFDAIFQLHDDRGVYPTIESYTDLSATEGVYSRYEWDGQKYLRRAQRQVFNVDGLECGTREQCRNTANEAFSQKQVDRAVRILEQVDGVSWI